MFGRSRADAVGQDVAELIIPPRFRNSHRRGFARFLATGEGQVLNTRTDLTALRADGTEFPVEVAVTRISASDPPLCCHAARGLEGANSALCQGSERNSSASTGGSSGMQSSSASGIRAESGIAASFADNPVSKIE